jgi:hypothetical protein
MLCLVGTCPVTLSFIATDSRQQQQQTEFDFFFDIDSGRCVLWITDMLSPQTEAGPSTGTPIMRDSCLRPLAISIPFFTATNSAPKTEVSTVGCLLENHVSGAEFKNAKQPVRERLTNWSPSVVRINMQTNFNLLTTR